MGMWQNCLKTPPIAYHQGKRACESTVRLRNTRKGLPMRTFAQKPKAPQQVIPAKPTIPGRAHFGQSPEVNSILHLHRAVGNQVLQRMLQTHAEELNTG